MKRILILTLTIVVLAILFFGWPTLYKYEHVYQTKVLVRINRITGEAEKLTGSGWKKMEPNLFDDLGILEKNQ